MQRVPQSNWRGSFLEEPFALLRTKPSSKHATSGVPSQQLLAPYTF